MSRRTRYLFVISCVLLLALSTHSLRLQDEDPVKSYMIMPLPTLDENFESRELDASVWEIEPNWQFVDDESGVIYCATDYGWVTRHQPRYQNFYWTFRIRLEDARSGVHIGYRINDVGRYVIHYSAGGAVLHKQLFGKDGESNLARVNVPIAPQVWHNVAIEGIENRITFYLDDVVQWEYTDPDPILAGAYSFENLEGTTCVDDLQALEFIVKPEDVPAMQTDGQPAYMAGSWEHLGGPIGGMGYDIRMNPFDPDKMIVTDALSGIHISDDGGQTWQVSNAGVQERGGASGDVVAAFSTTFDPNDPNIAWFGMQELGAVYRSTDGGHTWERRVNGIDRNGFTVRGITVQKGNSDIVYAMGAIASYAWAGRSLQENGFDRTQGVVYKTEDSGLTWREIWRGDNLARYLLIHPDDTNTLYLSTGIFDADAANCDYATNTPGGVGVLKSTDGGQTWTPINNGLQNLYIGSLAMNPDNPDVLLAAAGSHTFREGGGIYLTEDGGQTWTFRAGYHMTAVEFAPSDPNIAYATGEGPFYHSEDGGRTWDIYERPEMPGSGAWGPKGIYPGITIDIEVDPRNPQRLFLNSYGGGNFLSEDGGQTWVVAARGYSGADLIGMAVDPTNAGIVYVNGRSGPHRSTDGGVTWDGINIIASGQSWIAEGARIIVDPQQPAHLIAASGHWGWTYESFNRGETWTTRTNYWNKLRDDGSPGLQGPYALAFAPSNPKRVYLGFGQSSCVTDAYEPSCILETVESILVSYDGGITWGSPVATTQQTLDQRTVSGAQAVNVRSGPGTNNGVIGTLQPGLTITVLEQNADWLRFDYQGQTGWVNASLLSNAASGASMPHYSITTLVVHPTNPDKVWAATGSAGIYQSEDGGVTWRQTNQGLGDLKVMDLAMTPTQPDVLYAATAGRAIYKSEDGGNTWRSASAGMDTNEFASAVVVDPIRPEVVYAGTFKSGVYYSTDAGARWQKINDGLTSRWSKRLAISSDGSVLYYGTRGGGVFRLGALK